MKGRNRTELKRTGLAMTMVMLLILAPLGMMAGSIPGLHVSAASDEDGPIFEAYGNREKDLIFFLHSINASESNKVVAGHSTDKYMDTTMDFNGTSNVTKVTSETTFTWYLYPSLTGNLTVSHFDFKIWVWATSTIGTPQGNISVDLYEVTTTTWTHITGETTGAISFLRTADLRVLSGDFDHTFTAGSTVVVNMTLDLTAGDSIEFAYDTPKSNSRFQLRTEEGASLVSIDTLDHNGLVNDTFEPTEANKTIYITANVSDQLGAYDVRWVNVTLESHGAVILDNVSMTLVSGTNDTLYSEYRLTWNYSGHSNGRYNYTIWMTDNSGHNYFYHLQMYEWSNYTSEDEDFFTIGKMIYANLKVVDSKDNVLVGARVDMLISGSPFLAARATTNDTGMHNFSSLFTGSYDILVIWQGVVVANVSSTISDNITESDPLVIETDVFYPVFEIVDNKGNGLSDASIILGHPNGTSNPEPYKTNSTGEFDLTQAANGTYQFTISWMDVVVNDTLEDVTSNATLTIYTSVFHLATTIVDSRGGSLPGAQVVLANSSSGIVFDSKITNLSGGYEFRLPGGDYDITVFWQNTLIYSEANYTLDDDTVVTFIGDIFYLIVRVVDTHDIPVECAQVVILADEGNTLDSNFTDVQGRIDSRLPKGSHWVHVFWLGVLTNMTLVDFIDDSEVTLTASIYYPSFTVLDADGELLSNARVDFVVNETGEIVESKVTNDTGEITVRLPSTGYDISVYWKGVKVYDGMNTPIVEDHQIQLAVAVYNLEVICLDSRNEPLKDALVTLSLAKDGREMISMFTDVNGSATMKLPGATYDITVNWENTVVAIEEGFLLDRSGQHIVHGAVFYIDGIALDSQEVGLPGALVEVSDAQEGTITPLLTGPDGTFTVRLPTGVYDISISWKGRSVNSTEGLLLEGDASIDFSCSVFYLDLSPVDSMGVLINDALVTVISVSSNTTVASGTTGHAGLAGPLTFRLPGDTYDMTVHWREVLVNTTLDYTLDSDDGLEMLSSVYYLTVVVLDGDGKIVQDARVTVDLVSGSFNKTRGTDMTGALGFRLPAALYDIEISWRGVEVYRENARQLSTDDTWTLQAAIYYPMFVLTDSQGNAVGGAHLELHLVDGEVLMESADVSNEGTLLSRLPSTSYRVICTWLGHKVLDTVLDINSSGVKALELQVYYLDLIIEDSKALPLEDAIVDVAESDTGALLGTGITDETGSTLIRLPTSLYDILITWRGRTVHQGTTLQMDDDVSRTIPVKVHYLTLALRDDRQVAVTDALVVLELDGEDFDSAISDLDGEVVFRLPEGRYGSRVTWQGIEVGTVDDMVLDKDLERTVRLEIFYLTVSVRDSNGDRLKGALATVQRDGLVLTGASQTGGNGTVEFRLPAGDYTLKVRYSGTHLMTDYSSTLKKDLVLDSSMEERVTFSDYPPPVHTTNTFYIGALSVILLVLIIVAALKLLRPRPME